MGYRTTRMTGASQGRRLLVSAAAFLFAAVFLAHSVIAGGMLSHSQAPSEHALMRSQADHGSVPCHQIVSQGGAKASVGSGHDYSNDTRTPPCCGDACHLALTPQEVSSPERMSHEESILFVSGSLLSGRVLEGPRRPPRFSI